MSLRQRARRDVDKAERVGLILDGAREEWSRSSFNDFDIAAVARHAGIVKGTIYLYFPTKERLLLAVFESYIDEYFEAVNRMLEHRRGRWSAATIAEALTAPLRDRAPFLRLFPIVGSILEHNLDAAAAQAFKQVMADHFNRTGALICDRIDCDGARLVQRALALTAGFAAIESSSALNVRQADMLDELVKILTAG